MNNNELYPTWLVPLEIAKELKEIGFDEPCLFCSAEHKQLSPDLCIVLKEMVKILTTSFRLKDCEQYSNVYYKEHFKGSVNVFSIPMWEQALAWFRARGYYGNLETTSEGTSAYIFTPNLDMGTSWQFAHTPTYEAAREALLIKLIDIYKTTHQ